MNVMQYTKPNGTVGCGFLIEHAGKPQHSVAWADGDLERYLEDELQDRRIACGLCGQPCQRYQRQDGVIGVGFAAGERHAISWPDQVGQRIHSDKLIDHGIAIVGSCDGCSGECNPDPESEIPGTVEIGTEQTAEPIEEPTAEPTSEPTAEVIGTDDQTTVEQPASEPEPPKPEFIFDETLTEANNIANYLAVFPAATNSEVITALHGYGLEVSASQVSRQRKKLEPVQTDTSESAV